MPFPWAVPGGRSLRALCGPQGAAEPPRRQNAPRRPAAMAGEAHPVPSRTRKLSPRAPIVLRVKPVGDQDAAGRLGAFSPQEGPAPSAGPLFCAQAQSPRCKAPGFSMFGCDNLQVTCSLLSQFVCRLSCSCFIQGVAMICFGHRYFWAVTFGAHLPPYCPMKGQVLSHASQSTSLFC